VDYEHGEQNADDAEDDNDITLPPHKHCGNHSLNLVAGCDALKAHEDSSFRRSDEKAMAKVR